MQTIIGLCFETNKKKIDIIGLALMSTSHLAIKILIAPQLNLQLQCN